MSGWCSEPDTEREIAQWLLLTLSRHYRLYHISAYQSEPTPMIAYVVLDHIMVRRVHLPSEPA